MSEFHIQGRPIGPGQPAYIIAEMSANHQQKYEEAERIVHAAKQAGADAIKLQTYRPDTMTIDCDNEHFRIGKGTIWEGRVLHDLYGEAHTPWQWQPRLKQVAESLGLHCFSTPFDATAVDFLESINVPAYKIASFEIVDLQLLRKVAATGKPVIVSTGMASLAEINEALTTLREAGGSQIALLKCTSAYPASPQHMNLRTIPHLAEAFGVVTGLSDHSMGIAAPVAAVALGACIIEKHFTMSRQVSGPDSAFSLEPQEFHDMVQAVRVAEQALGRVSYGVDQTETSSTVFRRSLFIVKDVQAGQQLTEEHIRCIRPGLGLPPRYLPEILGRKAAQDLSRGTPLAWRHVA